MGDNINKKNKKHTFNLQNYPQVDHCPAYSQYLSTSDDGFIYYRLLLLFLDNHLTCVSLLRTLLCLINWRDRIRSRDRSGPNV